MSLPTVWTLGGGGLVGFVFPDAVLHWVGLAEHLTSDGVTACDLEMVEALALVVPHRFTLVRPQPVSALATQVQLG